MREAFFFICSSTCNPPQNFHMATLTNPHDDLFAGRCIQTATISIALNQWRSYGVVQRLSQAYVSNFSKVHPWKQEIRHAYREHWHDYVLAIQSVRVNRKGVIYSSFVLLIPLPFFTILSSIQQSQLIFLVWLPFLSRARKLFLKGRAVCKLRVIPNKLVACHM